MAFTTPEEEILLARLMRRPSHIKQLTNEELLDVIEEAEYNLRRAREQSQGRNTKLIEVIKEIGETLIAYNKEIKRQQALGTLIK